MKPMLQMLAALLLSALIFPSSLGRADNCLSYYSTVVKLNGTISKRTFPGPPNYRSIKRGDEPEVFWILHLTRAVCVRQGVDELDVPEKNVADVQLVLGPEQYAKFRSLVGRGTRVVATGKLFHAHTVHHRTPVLLEVEDIRRAR